jgi:hypothetical protein
MAAKGGLFAMLGGPPPRMGSGGSGASSAMPDMGADSEDDSGDSAPVGDEPDSPDEPGAGPFDAYAETIFDPKSDTPTKTDALRQAILTLIEERGGK